MPIAEFPRLGSDPFAELRRMQGEMNRLFSGFSAAAARDFPPVNVWLGENSVVVTAELPGVTRDEIGINLQTNTAMAITSGFLPYPKTSTAKNRSRAPGRCPALDAA